jgi:hypothetical protein
MNNHQIEELKAAIISALLRFPLEQEKWNYASD